MLENLRNRLRGVATEKQSQKEDMAEYHWRRDREGRLVDEFGNLIAESPDLERGVRDGHA